MPVCPVLTFSTALSLSFLVLIGLPLIAYCVWRAVAYARTPQGAVAWVVFLVTAPWFAVPAFLVFGRRKLADYRAAWRESRALASAFAAFKDEVDETVAGRAQELRALERIGGLPFVRGNALDLLIDGEATFDAICAEIERAERSICFQFYIIRDDEIGRRVGDLLCAAAKRGVAVRVMYDGVGSQRLSSRWPARLREAGAEVLNPDTSRGPTSRLNINFRNHRKTVVVDSRVAFVGGHNVGDEYLGRDPTFGPWRDTHLRIEGPVVIQVQRVFAEDWHWASGQSLAGALDWTPRDVASPGVLSALVPTGPGDDMDAGSLMFFTAITAARRRVWITSPYFVPDTDISAALVTAALAGRDVRLILPAAIDHYLPWLAAHAYYDEVRAAGVKIYRYCEGFMHQKVILVDDDLSAVGTANLDNRSFRLNFESMVFSEDREFAGRVEAMLEADLERSELFETPLTEQGRLIRVGAPLARLFAPVL